jgi:hypothetical protein
MTGFLKMANEETEIAKANSKTAYRKTMSHVLIALTVLAILIYFAFQLGLMYRASS